MTKNFITAEILCAEDPHMRTVTFIQNEVGSIEHTFGLTKQFKFW